MLKTLFGIFGSRSDRGDHARYREERITPRQCVGTRAVNAARPSRIPSMNLPMGRCHVIDGDMIAICGTRIMIAGMDAPEPEHPWGKKAKCELVQLCKGKPISAGIEPDILCDRIFSTCFLSDSRDLGAEDGAHGPGA